MFGEMDVNFMAEIFEMFTTFLIFLAIKFDVAGRKIQSKKRFQKMLLVLICVLIFDMLDHIPGINGRIWIVTMLYLAQDWLNLLFYDYLLSFFEKKRKQYRALTICVYGILIAQIVLTLCNIKTGWFFVVRNQIYTRGDLYWVSQVLGGLNLIIDMILILHCVKKTRSPRIFTLLCYPMFPMIGIVGQYFLPQFAFMQLSCCLAVQVIFLFIYLQYGESHQKQMDELERMRIALMLSQIQPHFIFNSLSSIRYLIKEDPDTAVFAIENFSGYLRKNFGSLENKGLVNIKQELEHTKEYLVLEHLRFGDRLNVSYNITCDDFFVPVLTLQPIVENAVKHGILEKEEGGNVHIETYETLSDYHIVVSDDGIGFDPDAPNTDGKVHVGLKNVQTRLEGQCGGEVLIESKPLAGTKITIIVPKKSEG